MATISDRLDRVEAEIRSLERELEELRRLAAAEQAPPESPPLPSLLPQHEESWLPPAPEPEPAAAPAAEPPRPVVWETRRREPVDWAGLLLDARVLAWAGGIVTALGIAFFFVLAVERGWIGPVARVSLGAGVSLLVFASAFELRRRFGDTYAAVSAAGAAIAGGYTTLLAAVALYELVPQWAALLVAAAIAAAAAATALAWNSQTLASIGLLGAMLAPTALAFQDGVSVVGGAFAALVLLPATAIAVQRRWQLLQLAALAVTAPYVLVLAYHHTAWTLPVAIACAVAYGGGGLALALRGHLSRLSGWFLLASALFLGGCIALLYSGTAEGLGLLAVAVAYVGCAVPLYRRDRDTATVMWAVGLAAGGIAAADLTSGATLTIVWAAEAACLAFLANRLRDARVEIGAFAWLALAIAHALIVDAPVQRLFTEGSDTLAAVPSAAALGAACAVIALCTRDRSVRAAGSALALTGGLYAASLGILAAAPTWAWGHVAVAGLWSIVAVLLAVRRPQAALALLGATAVLVVGYDLRELGAPEHFWACAPLAIAALAVTVLAAGALVESLSALVVSGAFAALWLAGLLVDKQEGAALVAAGAVYALTAVALARRRRDVASALGVVALLFGIVGSLELLHGTWLVLAWTVAAALLAVAARWEQRLEYASLSLIALAAAHTLVLESPPSHLFVSQRHPASGVVALLLVAGALAVFVRERELLRRPLTWVAGLLTLYAASLGILGLFEVGGEVDTAFQRGHTGVSALWAIAGATLLVAGVRRNRRSLQLGGIVLFIVSLAKLFLYDLAFLSSITRALSFLAVGAMLLAAGFVYQRLSTTAP